MTTIVPLLVQDDQAFCDLLVQLGLDRSAFTGELTQHSPPTYGPTVTTVKISWKDKLTINYGATEPSHWVEQFRNDWDSGLIPNAARDVNLVA